jgi:2-methylisocitrate lyase-like PEP mutase family enzyme
MGITQNEKATRFLALHSGPGAFVIPNPWDVGSAQLLSGLGFKALATSDALYVGPARCDLCVFRPAL